MINKFDWTGGDFETPEEPGAEHSPRRFLVVAIIVLLVSLALALLWWISF